MGSRCYIKNDEDNLGKFDPISDEGILLVYSFNKKTYKCYNLRLLKIVESANVNIDDLNLRQVIPHNISTYDYESDGEYQNE